MNADYASTAPIAPVAPIADFARPAMLAVDEGVGADLDIVPRADARRSGLEEFIAATFSRIYGARIAHFAEHLAGVRHPNGQWMAGVGYTPAGRAPLFIEQYLDCPIEIAIGDRLGVSVDRSQIVEVGNLAATTPGGARRLIIRMTTLLHRLGHTWVVFTSTRALLNSFARLDIPLMVLAPADPGRLDGGAEHWGSYYEAQPQVMTGSIPIGFIQSLSKRAHARSL